MRFYFVDRITFVEPGRRMRGYKNVSMAEPYFDTHFPRFPVLPGVVLIEAMAQLAGLLVEISPDPGEPSSPPTSLVSPAPASRAAIAPTLPPSADHPGDEATRPPSPDRAAATGPLTIRPERKAILSIVDRIKFKRLVRPGDRVDLEAELVVLDPDGARAAVTATIDGELVASTRLTFALMPVPPEFDRFLREERQALLSALQIDPQKPIGYRS